MIQFTFTIKISSFTVHYLKLIPFFVPPTLNEALFIMTEVVNSLKVIQFLKNKIKHEK